LLTLNDMSAIVFTPSALQANQSCACFAAIAARHPLVVYDCNLQVPAVRRQLLCRRPEDPAVPTNAFRFNREVFIQK
jgi:hypothetical protein